MECTEDPRRFFVSSRGKDRKQKESSSYIFQLIELEAAATERLGWINNYFHEKAGKFDKIYLSRDCIFDVH